MVVSTNITANIVNVNVHKPLNFVSISKSTALNDIEENISIFGTDYTALTYFVSVNNKISVGTIISQSEVSFFKNLEYDVAVSHLVYLSFNGMDWFSNPLVELTIIND